MKTRENVGARKATKSPEISAESKPSKALKSQNETQNKSNNP